MSLSTFARRCVGPLLIAAGGGLATAACAAGPGAATTTTEIRHVTGYGGVLVRGPFQVVLRASGREGVELRGAADLLPRIETRLVDGGHGGVGRVLELRWRDGTSVPRQPDVAVTIDVTALRSVAVEGSGDVQGDRLNTPELALRIAGSGDVRLTDLTTDDLAIAVSGSGDVQVRGRAPRLSVAISGSGDVDTDGLEADDVSVRVAGSGDAAVTARRRLAVSIAGSGDVIYRGDVQPQVAIAGSGRLRRR